MVPRRSIACAGSFPAVSTHFEPRLEDPHEPGDLPGSTEEGPNTDIEVTSRMGGFIREETSTRRGSVSYAVRSRIGDGRFAGNRSPARQSRKNQVSKRTAFLVCAALVCVASYASATTEYRTPGSALIIGNRDQEAPYAHRDALAFEHFVLNVRRFDPGQVRLLRDATETEITSALQSVGHQESPEVIVYFSGHRIRGTGGARDPLDLLFTNVPGVNARVMHILLETSPASTAEQTLRRSFFKEAGYEFAALVAASPNETALADERARQGLFTLHLLDALYGWADDNGDGQVTAAEAKTYLDDTMTEYARRELGRSQTARLVGTGDVAISMEPAVPAFGAPPAPAVSGREGRVASQAPDPTAWSVEAILSLNRAERRLIQRGLASAQLDVGPLDGIFGPRTRAAIAQWQARRGEPPIGYLDAEGAAALLAAGRAAFPSEATPENGTGR